MTMTDRHKHFLRQPLSGMEDPSADLNPNSAEPVVESLDFAKHFATDKEFSTRDDLLKWVRGEAAKLGFGIVISKSNNRGTQTLMLECKRSGVYKKQSKRQDTRFKKCECPFRLRGYFLSSGVWEITVMCGKHNHEMMENLEDHPIAGRLNEEEMKLVHEMTINTVRPKNILMTLKKRRADDGITIKQIYNARSRYNKSMKGPKSEELVDDDGAPKEDRPDISILPELEAIQIRFNNADYNTKILIKEQLHQIAFPETTAPCPPAAKENWDFYDFETCEI